MAQYTMDEVFEDVLFEHGGCQFRLRQRTKGLSHKLVEKQEALDNLPDDATDEDGVAIALELLDLVMEPLGDGNGQGPKTRIKTLLAKEYNDEELGADRIFGLLNLFGSKMVARMDPTLSLGSES